MPRLARRAVLLLVVIGSVAVVARVAQHSEKVPKAAKQQTATASEVSLSSQIIPRTDLPPPGTRSLFDHVLKQNDGLPYPFERLIELVARYDGEGQRPAAVLIPDGRSLLRAQATFQKPRIVLAASVRPARSDADLGLVLRGRLFLGFVEDAREIEVISYNEEAGRYEFQLVKDYYEGGVPRIIYAARSLCTTCHANEAPIFPVRPWDETNAQPAVARKILEAREIPPEQAEKAEYFGVPIMNKLAAAETIDDLVNLANVIPTTQRVWIDGCGGDPSRSVECRSLMLRLALRFAWNPTGFSAEDGDAKKLIALQRESWPKSGILLQNPSLRNRNPFTDKASRRGWMQRLRAWFAPPARSTRPRQTLRTLPPVAPEFDPLRPRRPRKVLSADALDGVSGVAQLLGPNDKQLLEKHGHYDLPTIDRAAESDRLTPLLGPAPFRRSAVMIALLQGLGVKDLPATSGVSTEGMSPPVVEGVKPLEIHEGSVLKYYERYCFGCHRGNPAARLDFMSGDTAEDVLDRLKQVSEIREVLDYDRYLGSQKESRLMPPKDSWQRKELDEARAHGEDDLKKMVDAVPGLFGP